MGQKVNPHGLRVGVIKVCVIHMDGKEDLVARSLCRLIAFAVFPTLGYLIYPVALR